MKPFLSTLLSLVLVTIPSVLQAASVLHLGDGITLHTVNGESSTEKGTVFSKNEIFNLPNGQNQLVISYTVELLTGNDSELETVGPVVITFMAKESTVYLKGPEIRKERDLEHFNQALNWDLTTEKGALQYTTELLPVSGFRLGLDYESAVRKYNQKKGVRLLPQNVEFSDTSNAKNSVGDVSQIMVLQMLEYWYQQAAPSTRDAFKHKITQ